MGTSLADRAWGARCRLQGQRGANRGSGLVVNSLRGIYRGLPRGIVPDVGWQDRDRDHGVARGFLLYKSSRLHTRLKDREERQQQFLSTEAELITETNKELHRVMEKALSVYKRNIEGLKDEDRRTMKKAQKEANELYERLKDKRKYEVVPTLENIQLNALDVEQEYVQLVDYSYEISKALKAMTEATFEYIDNNHTAFSKEQIDDITDTYKTLSEVYSSYAAMENGRLLTIQHGDQPA